MGSLWEVYGKSNSPIDSKVLRHFPLLSHVLPTTVQDMTTTPAPRDQALVSFGAEVRAARERAGKRQEDFAGEMGVTRRTMSNIETGNERASNLLYWKVANALDLDASSVVREQAS